MAWLRMMLVNGSFRLGGYCVYIMASVSGTLYIGLTNNLKRRVWEHKQHLVEGFSDEHDTERLLYFESFEGVSAAIKREKQLKGWKREKKIRLIDSTNCSWDDLADGWY